MPNTALKDIQIDLNDKQMVIQTKDYYLCQYFQYKTDPKATKAKFISDKGILELIIPILRNDDFWPIICNCFDCDIKYHFN